MTSTDLEPITPSTGLAPITPPDTDSWVEVVGQVAKLAAHVADTDFVAKGLRGSAAAVTAAILYGREIGLPPMTALTQVRVVEGMPSLSAEGMRALILAAGHDLEIRQATGAISTVAGRRRGSGRWQEVTWTLDMARAAGIIKPKSGWEHYPRAMLVARATVELARQLFPDVIHGFRAVEEISDETPTETERPALDPAPGPTVRRAPKGSRKASTPPVAPSPTETPDRPTPPLPLPGEDTYTETPTIEAQSTPPAASMVGPQTPADAEAPGPDPADRPAPKGGRAGERRPSSPAGHDSDPSAGGVTSQDAPPAEAEVGTVSHETLGPDETADFIEAEIVDAPDVPDEIEVVEPVETEPAARGIDVQAVRLAFVKGLGITDRDSRLAYVSAIVGREIDTTVKLTRREAATILDTLRYCSTVEDLDRSVTATLEHRAAAETPQTPEG